VQQHTLTEDIQEARSLSDKVRHSRLTAMDLHFCAEMKGKRDSKSSRGNGCMVRWNATMVFSEAQTKSSGGVVD
jgi:hypothetical protein